jgi:hypothetical protein
VALLVDDVVERVGDLLVDAAEIEPVETILALPADEASAEKNRT